MESAHAGACFMSAPASCLLWAASVRIGADSSGASFGDETPRRTSHRSRADAATTGSGPPGRPVPGARAARDRAGAGGSRRRPRRFRPGERCRRCIRGDRPREPRRRHPPRWPPAVVRAPRARPSQGATEAPAGVSRSQVRNRARRRARRRTPPRGPAVARPGRERAPPRVGVGASRRRDVHATGWRPRRPDHHLVARGTRRARPCRPGRHTRRGRVPPVSGRAHERRTSTPDPGRRTIRLRIRGATTARPRRSQGNQDERCRARRRCRSSGGCVRARRSWFGTCSS